MAIAQMKKLKLLGLKTEQNMILGALQQTKAVELKKTGDFELLPQGGDVISNTDDLSVKLSRLNYAVNLIEDAQRERAKIKTDDQKAVKVKKPLFSVRESVSFNDFFMIGENEYEIFGYVAQTEKNGERLSSFKSEISKLNNFIDQLKLYKDIDIPLNMFNDTKSAKIMLGTIPSEFEKPVREYFENQQNIVTEIYKNAGNIAVAVICAASDYQQIAQKLSKFSFSRVTFSHTKTPDEVTKDYLKEIERIEKQRISVLEKISELSSKLGEIKLLYDYYNLAQHTKEQKKDFKNSASTFILEGYVPAEYTDGVLQAVSLKTQNVIAEISDIEEGDNPPTYVKNNKLITPFETITDLYSAPSYGERDPNIFVAIFFFLFFGIMLSDAGYGLVLALGSFFLIKKYKMESSVKKVITVIALGGISTVIWGTVFGNWFGMDISQAAQSGNFIAVALNSLKWFNPLDEPLLMMGLCLALGVFQILFGLGIRGVELIKRGKIGSALMDVGSWYMLFTGIGMIGLGTIYPSLSDIGVYLIIASLALLVLTQGREKKGIFAKFFKGLASLYDIVGYIGDIISYTRLFGLALASAVVGLIMNTMAGMLFESWYLVIFGVVILLVGHTFNLGVSVLSGYIHNSRLQYVEFFSRFYTGGGHAFKPYGSNLKYYAIK